MAPPLDPAVLRGMPLFAGLGADALAEAVALARPRRHARGAAVFTQGEAAAAGHALIDGRVKIVQTGPDGQQVVMRFIGPGEMFGTLAIFTDGLYPADAVAVADSVELSWPAAAMTDLMERRVAHALLRLVRQAGRWVETGVEIDFPLSRQDVAEMTGTTLHTVSRTLSAWESQGIVESGRQQVVICKPHALVAIAEDLPPIRSGD